MALRERAVDTLVDRGVIDVPQIEEDQTTTSHGRVHATTVYRLDKRSSLIVVAQLALDESMERDGVGLFEISETLRMALFIARNDNGDCPA